MTAQEIIEESLKELGVTNKGEPLDADDAQDALFRLNRMLETWSGRRVAVRYEVEDSKVLTAGDADYTIGTGGEINTVLPIEIIGAYLKFTPDNNWLQPIDIEKSGTRFFSFPDRLLVSSIPRKLYYDKTYPLGTIHLYYTPDKAYTLFIRSWKPLSTLASLSTNVTLDPIYNEPILYNLAVRLAPQFGVTPTQITVDAAKETFRNLMRLAKPDMQANLDNPLGRTQNQSTNIYTGDW